MSTQNPSSPEELRYCYTTWLRHYPDCWTADGGIDGVKLLQGVTAIPGVRYLLELSQLVHDGEVPWRYLDPAQAIVSGLLDVIVLAAPGDEQAANQLIAIQKLVRPQAYNLPQSVIKNIAERYYSSPHLARGSYLRYVMYFLKRIVTPACSKKPLTARIARPNW